MAMVLAFVYMAEPTTTLYSMGQFMRSPECVTLLMIVAWAYVCLKNAHIWRWWVNGAYARVHGIQDASCSKVAPASPGG